MPDTIETLNNQTKASYTVGIQFTPNLSQHIDM